MGNNMMNQPCLSKIGVEKALSKALGKDFNETLSKIVNENFIGWFSRSVATALFTFARNKSGKWCVLANKRGQGCPDFVGYWCAPCGYLEFDITTRENAVKEMLEETGVHIKPETLVLHKVDDSPMANRQNVTFIYYNIIGKKMPKFIPSFIQGVIDKSSYKTEDFKLSKNLSEENEVDAIEWIPLDEIDNFSWAFGHKSLITDIAKKNGLI